MPKHGVIKGYRWCGGNEICILDFGTTKRQTGWISLITLEPGLIINETS